MAEPNLVNGAGLPASRSCVPLLNKMRSIVALLFVLVAGPLSAADANFHLYLLIGQSNMAGRKVTLADKVAVPRVLMLNKANEWVSAVTPFRLIKKLPGPPHPLSESMAQATNVKIGLIPCAGGTPICRWQQNGDLYQVRSSAPSLRSRLALSKILWHRARGFRERGYG